MACYYLVMTDLSQLMAEWQSAETAQFEVAEIEGFEAVDGHAGRVTLVVDERTNDETCRADESADEDVTEGDTTDDTDAASDTESAHEAEMTKPTEDLVSYGNTDDTDADDTDTDDDQGPKTWTVNGRDLRYNDLQTAISESEMDYPSDTSGDNMAKLLREAASDPNTDDQSESESDESNDTESDTNDENGGVTDEYLKDQGVKPQNISTVREYRQKHGVCAENGCVYGCNDDSDYCASHQESGSSGSDTPADNRELSDLNSTDKKLVIQLMEEGKSKQEAIDMV